MQKDAVSKKYTELRDYYDTDNNFLVSYDKDGCNEFEYTEKI